LYKLSYLNWLETEMGVLPVELTTNDTILLKILNTDANAKYISQTESKLDETIKLASSKKGAI
jgi:hypothetical protein